MPAVTTPAMRRIWGGILLTMLAFQSLVWAGGHGVERKNALIAWGIHENLLSEDQRELVGQEMQKKCPEVFKGHSPQEPVVVSEMTSYKADLKDDVPTKRYLVKLKQKTYKKRDGKKAKTNHWIAVIVEQRTDPATPKDVMVLPVGDRQDCKP